MQSSVSRDQVRNEFLQFRGNPVAADGGRFFGGEAGYVFPAHTYARVNGEWVCTDKIAHNPKPDAIKTPTEQHAFRQQTMCELKRRPARRAASPRSQAGTCIGTKMTVRRQIENGVLVVDARNGRPHEKA